MLIDAVRLAGTVRRMKHEHGRSIIHDRNGTYFDPASLVASLLSEEQHTALEFLGVVPSPDEAPSDWAFGYIDGGSFTSLVRVLTLWLPDAVLEEDEVGELVIHTRLRVSSDGDTLRARNGGGD